MNKITKTITGFLLLTLLFVFSCQEKADSKTDTILEGKATIYVDESVLPIIEDQEAVFETQYNAKLHLVAQSENEILNSLLNDSAKIAVLTRTLSTKEIKVLESKKITPRITPFATDAVAFIKSKTANDTIVVLQDIIDFISGKPVPNIKGLVFDNPNSSTVRFMSEIAGMKIDKQKNVFSFKTNEEVIKYVAENNGMIGVIGMNWIFQPPLDLQKVVDQVNVLGVKGKDSNEYVFPTQDNLAQGKYPLARHLYIVNCQGYSGLGMGFGSFLGGERGQRIILKSGLVPERVPTRKIVIKNNNTKDNN
ncbi:MAG: phosphate ABC transporter substrate-binding protein [Flavobacterium sp.]|uniref:PstS family phosphate ABC transporter substrate-binding protein n=1 Tax=unclassified Flavobacterium TaxID=196869 RepID=UPI000EAFE6F2|nr:MULTISPECIES: substrate-binding domain-containing protein [unclassified Flavobacterium]MBA4135416.1 phosphate ABC transporter substrate-binding protein [Flavobacterium sp.]RKS01600.1 phosphate ABC transporter substrate-binding protein (PhoT family) [Flavobacterium sp. 102]